MNYNNPKVKAILKRLRKQKWPQQYKAIRKLASQRSPSADIVLLHLLESEEWYVKANALDAIRKRSAVLGRIAARTTLDDVSMVTRSEAVEMLGEIGTRQDIRRLRHALQDKKWMVRCSAVDSVGRIGGKGAVRLLKTALRHDAFSDAGLQYRVTYHYIRR